jgi:hypothetical protein
VAKTPVFATHGQAGISGADPSSVVTVAEEGFATSGGCLTRCRSAGGTLTKMRQSSPEAIIKTYRSMVDERGGIPIGERVFTREAGISPYNWKGGYWRSWSAFQQAAGYAPNDPTQRIPDETLLCRFAELALELSHIPIEADLSLKRKKDPTFPGKLVFRRWGSRDALLNAVNEFCKDKQEFAPVVKLLSQGKDQRLEHRIDSLRISGFVYLIRSGKDYKLGRTNAVGRRFRELAIQLPRKPETVHVIETDDPEGIEEYWHKRFADKRQGGEWFALSPDDVRAFKKRRFQ